jgi:hypothetical protein
MELAVLKFASMEDLMAFKQMAKISGINSKYEYESNTFKGHLAESDIRIAIELFSATRIIPTQEKSQS